MRVYVSAFSCEPGRGSEPGVGFAFARAAAQLASKRPSDTFTLVTRPHVVHKIEAALASEGLAGQLVIRPISLPMSIVKLTHKRHIRFAYLLWQVLVAIQLRGELKQYDSVVFHHVTFATEALPTAIFGLPKHVRCVMGPVGSAQTLNMMEISTASRLRKCRGRLRAALREHGGRLNFSRCDLIVAQTDDAANRFERSGVDVVVEPNCVIDMPPHPTALAALSNPRRVVSVGVLEDGKRHDLIIRSLTYPVLNNCQLAIYGTGSQEAHLRKTAHDLGLSGRVTFCGWRPRQELLAEIRHADCLVSASRQEGSAWSVAEAQSLGLSVVAFEGSGIETLIRLAGHGFLVKAHASNAELADRIAEAVASPRPPPTSRWTAGRLPALLAEWYGLESIENGSHQ